jgi:hypothetical protein
MKTISFLLITFFFFSVSFAQKKPIEKQKSPRIEKIINSQWTFNYIPDEGANKGYESPGFDDSKWSAISLPHTWNTYETTGEFINSGETGNPYWRNGWGWYRKHFSFNADYTGRKVFIEFEGVQKYCKVWINGTYLGDHNDGFSSFDFDITGYLKPGKDNVLVVSVNNRQNDESDKSPDAQVNFTLYGGINRDVTLVLKNKLFIPMQGSASHEGGTSVTAPQVSEKEGVVRVQTWVKNDYPQKKNCTLITSIVDATNKTLQAIKSDAVISPGQLYKYDQTSKPIKKPHLWSNKNPYLYKVYSELIDGNEVADTFTSPLSMKLDATEDTTLILTTNLIPGGIAEAFIKNTDKTPALTSQGIVAGEPAKIVLTGSRQKIGADRSSTVKITADVVDSKGNHVFGANNTVKWIVTGPATLVGPSIYESSSNKRDDMERVWYLDMPVMNIIRSTGKPGKIHVSVSASGLASGSFDIMADEIKPDHSVITEPVLEDEGRKPVTRITLSVNRLEEVPREINFTNDEFNLPPSDKKGFARVIRDYMLKNNPSIDSASIEFKTLVDLFASHLLNNKGRLVADDYNFNADHFNNCRLIYGYINSTRLPPLFKEGLKKYYANAIIRQGSEKNAGDEMNWLNWIPSGGTVVISVDKKPVVYPKGTIITDVTELSDIIALVHPRFPTFSDEAKERALIFISKMNPYIKVTPAGTQSISGDKMKATNISYTAEKGQPILIPLLKFISE